jgi:hypothetical protein
MHADQVAYTITIEAAEALLKIDQARKTKACDSLDKAHSKGCNQASDWVSADRSKVLSLKAEKAK